MTKRLVFLAVLASLAFVVSLAQAGVPGFMKARMGVAEGTFLSGTEIQPLAGAIVSFFNKDGGPPPIVGSVRRVPDMVSRTDQTGKFTVRLLPGQYYMGALVREANAGPGPPREGEKYFFAMAEEGKLLTFSVKTKETTQIGQVTGQTPDKFKEFSDFVTIRGTVADENGKAIEGILITIRDQPQSPRPKYISDRTKADGSYELKLPPGAYYIKARESLQGGRPRPGSYIGAYGKSAPVDSVAPANSTGVSGGAPPGAGMQVGGGQALVLQTESGKVYEDVDIHLYKIPDPDDTRRKFEEEARIRKEAEAKAEAKAKETK